MGSEMLSSSHGFERLFDRFVQEQTFGIRFDEATDIAVPTGTKCADYWFADARVAIELKTLSQDHSSRDQVFKHVDQGLKKFGYRSELRNSWVEGKVALPTKVARFVDRKVQNSIKGAIRKANSQLLATRRLVGTDINTILLIANLNERLFGPRELLKYISGQVLERNSPQIDATILISPGVEYTSGSEAPWHYLETAYADGMEHLGDLVEPFLRAWIDFEATTLGVRAVVDSSREATDQQNRARPVEQK